MLGKKCNLDNPILFSDKLEWLKIYDSTFLKTYCSDKILAREYVKNKLGRDISIPIIKVYNNFDEIEFDNLPKNYVIKTNHGSHTNIIVKNNNLNKKNAKRKIVEWLSKDWSWYGYELHYIPIKRKIFIEQYMPCEQGLTDYKFYCFNGEPKFCQVVSDRNNKMKKNYYDLEWKEMNISQKNELKNLKIKKPETFAEMIEISKKLSKDFKFVRVDLYEIQNKVYFGELTFIPGAAYLKWNYESDLFLGELLSL